MKVSTILDSIDQGNVALPEFQRGYVWGREQVRELMRSLYRRYPVGGLLVWETRAESTAIRGTGASSLVVRLLLDGQQRVTTLYGVMRGHPPTFFQGADKAFTGLHFHLEDEVFEFYGPVKMRGDPRWVDVTQLFKTGLDPWFERLPELGLGSEVGRYTGRLNKIVGIADIDLHLDEIAPGMAVDEVVDVFNRLNSGGTKLSQGDLALARICAAWPEARTRLVALRDGWRAAGFDFTLDWLLRVVNAIVTGEARFSALKDVSPAAFSDGLVQAGDAVDQLLNLVGSRLGLDHDRVLGGRYGFPVMARYWSSVPRGTMTDEDRGKLLYWYLQAALWGRHSGSTESVLDQDLEAWRRGGLDGLIEQLRIWRGDLAIRPENLIGANVGSRLYPLVYLLSRVHGARDLGTGNAITGHLLGRLARLELHHVFPKARLQAHGYAQPDRNALANFCFLTQDTNLAIGMRLPSEYLPEVEARNPGVLASQWIPDDPELWHLDRYPDFLDARRRLLAGAANAFLDSLVAGAAAPSAAEVATASQPVVVGEPDALRLKALAAEAVGRGLAAPEFDHDVVDDASGEVQAWANLAWPNGVQTGLTQPVAYLAERSDELQGRFGELGWRCYTDEIGLRRYFEEILGVDLDGDGVVGMVPEEDERLSGDARCWLVRAGHGGWLAPDFERLGVVTIGWTRIPGLGDLRGHDDGDVLGLLHDAGKVHAGRSLRMLRWFYAGMAEGDVVVTPDSRVGDLLVGVIGGAYDYADQPITGDRHRHVRKVRWLGRRPRDLADPHAVTKNRALRTIALLPDQQHWLDLARDLLPRTDQPGGG